MGNHESASKGLETRRVAAMSKVYLAILADRWNLRRAARHSGNPKLKRRLRRLAFRRSREASDLAETGALKDVATHATSSVDSFSRDIGRANEISTVAACLRSNRRLRIALERALAVNPPDRVAQRLTELRDSSSAEAGLLEARLRDIAMQGFAGSPPIED